jgi:DNA invertase Pin-like site-specific DNA recombinase
MLIVWKLDRLGQSLGFLCELIDRFGQQGIGFKSMTDGIDTTTSGGKLVFHIMRALAKFEHSLIGERTKVGIKAVKKRGKRIGCSPALNAAQLDHMRELSLFCRL